MLVSRGDLEHLGKCVQHTPFICWLLELFPLKQYSSYKKKTPTQKHQKGKKPQRWKNCTTKRELEILFGFQHRGDKKGEGISLENQGALSQNLKAEQWNWNFRWSVQMYFFSSSTFQHDKCTKLPLIPSFSTKEVSQREKKTSNLTLYIIQTGILFSIICHKSTRFPQVYPGLRMFGL